VCVFFFLLFPFLYNIHHHQYFFIIFKQ